MHYIAESQYHNFARELSMLYFCSFLMDGSTDAGNIENEVVVLMYCKKDDVNQLMRSEARYLSLQQPVKADADGMISCLNDALKVSGIDNVLHKESVLGVAGSNKPIIVGGTDGASVNIGDHNGMKAKLQQRLPWLIWTWCFAHRLELACKNSMSSQLFTEVLEMLQKLYTMYSRSPKKSRELSEIAGDLKEVFELPKGGNLPVQCQGTRWINYKRKALLCLVDRYGSYLIHVSTIVEDGSIPVIDRARYGGYLTKWKEAKMLIGAAMYADVLKPPSILSLSLQEESIDVVKGIHCLLKTTKSLNGLAEQDPLQWPTVKKALSRIEDKEGKHSYQTAVICNYTQESTRTCAHLVCKDLKRLISRIKE